MNCCSVINTNQYYSSVPIQYFYIFKYLNYENSKENNKTDCTKSSSYPLSSTPIYSYPLPLTPTNYFQLVFKSYCKIPLIARVYIQEEKHFHLQSVILTVLSFFQYKVFLHFSRRTRCEICSKLTIKTPEYVNLTIKLKIKTPLTSFWPLYC